MGSNDADCLDKKNLTVTDYNSNMQEMSSKSITYKQCNNNLHPFNFSDEKNCKIKQKLCEKSQNSKGMCILFKCNFIFSSLYIIIIIEMLKNNFTLKFFNYIFKCI